LGYAPDPQRQPSFSCGAGLKEPVGCFDPSGEGFGNAPPTQRVERHGRIADGHPTVGHHDSPNARPSIETAPAMTFNAALETLAAGAGQWAALELIVQEAAAVLPSLGQQIGVGKEHGELLPRANHHGSSGMYPYTMNVRRPIADTVGRKNFSDA
jgi:hypothetical protein